MKRGSIFPFALLAALLPAGLLAAENFEIRLPASIPRELWAYFVPRDNPMSAPKVELGKTLFFDPRLSADGTVSCATCHDPEKGFTDGKPVALGIGGRKGKRNAPTLLNAMFYAAQFRDGRADSLEAQAKLPLIDPSEMGNGSYSAVVARVRAIPEYEERFRDVFGTTATVDSIAKAIATFERTLVSGNSRYDRFGAGDSGALSAAEQRGLAVFRGKGRCSVCHTLNTAFPFFSDQTFRNTGVSARDPGFETLARRATEATRRGHVSPPPGEISGHEGAAELGRFLVTGDSVDIGAFKVPSLRDVELTAPYFHDGSARSLADVVRFYSQGGNSDPRRDWELQAVNLDEGEQTDLVLFLKTLTGSREGEK